MIDIETTGIDPATNDLLEIGIVRMVMNNRGYYEPHERYRRVFYSPRKPESSFAKEHMVALYAEANKAPLVETSIIRADILKFFELCGATKRDDVEFCGWNASSFDIPFLHAKGLLKAPGYEPGPDGKDMPVGDHSYRYYEMGGAVSLVQDMIGEGIPRKEVIRMAEVLGQAKSTNIEVGPGKDHDAIFDCLKQIKLLNGLLAMSRGARA